MLLRSVFKKNEVYKNRTATIHCYAPTYGFTYLQMIILSMNFIDSINIHHFAVKCQISNFMAFDSKLIPIELVDNLIRSNTPIMFYKGHSIRDTSQIF